VTYVIEGSAWHEDFLGNSGILRKGDVQWMTAGRGIMHSEVPYIEPGVDQKTLKMRGIQLWIDLPAKDKMCEPSYQERKAKE
jgi:redox-sensitive bicupin YhaK (pirin superfamily)